MQAFQVLADETNESLHSRLVAFLDGLKPVGDQKPHMGTLIMPNGDKFTVMRCEPQ